MFLRQSTIVIVVVVLLGAVNCGFWRSDESHSRSSEEYRGGVVPPLQLGGAVLPVPAGHHPNGVPQYTPYQNPLHQPQFTNLIQANTVLIQDAMGPKKTLSYVSKAYRVPMPEGNGQMYYVKAYFNNEHGYRNKCNFHLYADSKGAAQVLEPRCY